ncbi:MAG: hypothetical protein JXX29_07950 [Deltaproteobacteria bacterium]|nr:hypothetical protein [Deltaproteobacteria bacterium]MBN2671591.1 hypothetical protein [Deltaproteobacteria bacterium]
MSQQNRSTGLGAGKTLALLLFFFVFLVAAAAVVLAYLPPEKRPVQLPFELPFGKKAPPTTATDTDTEPAPPEPIDLSRAQFAATGEIPAPQEGRWRNMVAAYDNLALVGNPSNAFLFAFEDGKWQPQEKLFPSDNAPGVESVALAENVAVVEANERLFIFNRPLTGWRFLTTVVPDPEDPQLQIGRPVVTTSHIFVPVPSRNSILIFQLQKGTQDPYGKIIEEDKWNLTATLTPPDAADQAFGYAVAAAENKVAVSTLCNASSGNCVGTVYLFEQTNDGHWLQTEKFTSPSLDVDTLYGFSLAMTTDTLFVGAPCDGGVYPCEGAVYPYQKIETAWTPLTALKHPHPTEGGRFGTHLSAGKNGVAATSATNRAAEFFAFKEGAWHHAQTLLHPAPSGETSPQNEPTADFVVIGRGGILLGSHLESSSDDASAKRVLAPWCIVGEQGCSSTVEPTPDNKTTEPEITAITESSYQPIQVSCDGQSAMECAAAYCKDSKIRKCRPEGIVKQLAAETYLTTHHCPVANIERNDNSWSCGLVDEQQETICMPSVTALAFGAFVQKGEEEVLLVVTDKCSRAHEQGWSFGYVMQWENGKFVNKRNLSIDEARFSDRISVPQQFPTLDGEAIVVLGSFIGEDEKSRMVYCISEERRSVTEWECIDSTPSEPGIYFLLWDNFSSESNKRKQRGCALVAANQKKINDDDYPDLNVTVECTKDVNIDQKKRARKPEKYNIEILFDGTNFALADELPAPIAYRESQNEN